MREIVPNRLWVGHADDARAVRRLHDAGIEAVVDLAWEESPARLSRNLVYCRFPLVDGADNPPALLVTAITTTCALIRNEVPTLVACSAGTSRSPCILAAALALVRGTSPDQCLRDLIEGQPQEVSPVLWADVLSAQDQLVA